MPECKREREGAKERESEILKFTDKILSIKPQMTLLISNLIETFLD